MGYVLGGLERHLFVAGHYETACGGADTINWAKTKPGTPEPGVTGWGFVNRLVKQHAEDGCDVLYEGLMVGYDKRFITDFKEDGHEVAVIGLTTSIDTCIERIKKRREARGDFSKFYPYNTRQRIPAYDRCMEKLEAMGVRVHRCSIEDGFRLCCKWLGIPSEVSMIDCHQESLRGSFK